MNELKPCPFCGGKASITEYASGHKGDGVFTASYKAGCDNGQPEFAFNGYELVTEAWNMRYADGTD